jgi:Holliday junction resolvase RusA-like endonuclease
MPRVDIKPLSVNQAWQGKRFKTPAYKQYEKQVLLMLPKIDVPEGKLALNIRFGLSSKNADVDNPVKCFVDCMQKKYGFNDRNIYKMSIEKVDVKKGHEFIEFSVSDML